jgi:hypothetical protein
LSAAAPIASRPFRLELIPSRALAAAIVLAHLAAAACMLTVLTGWPAVALAALFLMLGGIAAWDRALLRAPRSPRQIEVHPDGGAKCLFANGESTDLGPECVRAVTRYWVALRMRTLRRRSLFIASGMLAPDDFRRLRLWALWGRLPGLATERASPEQV